MYEVIETSSDSSLTLLAKLDLCKRWILYVVFVEQ